ncbi:Uncharacterized protein APZ42_010002, partial [Daphnia magna]
TRHNQSINKTSLDWLLVPSCDSPSASVTTPEMRGFVMNPHFRQTESFGNFHNV